MIVVKVELHSAITGRVSEIARAEICNVGGTRDSGEYEADLKWRNSEFGSWLSLARKGRVRGYPRLSSNIWVLVMRALRSAFPEET